MPPAPSPFPLVLVGQGAGPFAAFVERMLETSGYALLRAQSSREALEQARESRSDLIVLADTLPGLDIVSLCRAVRSDPEVAATTPILLISSHPSHERAIRLAGLRAGAWEVFHFPLDEEEFLLKIAAWIAAKVAGDRQREESLLDPATGLYSPNGLLRRAREIGAEADRNRRAIACIALKPSLVPPFAEGGTGERHDSMARAVHRVVAVFRRHARTSDVVGRLSRHEFAVIAPGTDSAGALHLVQRLCRAAAEPESLDGGIPVKLRVGCFAVEDFHSATLTPADMLLYAARELNRSAGNTSRGAIDR